MALDKEALTRIYNEANGIGQGKNPPISTEFIFNAMNKSYELGVQEERERLAKQFDEAGWHPYAEVIRNSNNDRKGCDSNSHIYIEST